MSLPEPSLENLGLGLHNVNIHNGKYDDSRISKGYMSNNKVSLHNGKGMYKEEEDVEEEEEDDDIEADILRQSGYSTIKKPSNQPMLIKDVEDEEEEEEEDDDDIEADILRQSGYSTIKKPSNQPMPVEDVEEEEEEEEEEDDIEADILRQSGYSNIKKQQMPTIEDEDEEDEDEEEDDITTDILKQSGYGSMKKPTHRSTLKTAAPIKLVSALRGSREKEGTPTRIMSVTWSPEVYDPIPSAETFVRIKKPRLKSDSKKIQELKKNGKPIGKDKGKASKAGKGGGGGSRSSSSKDKKTKYSNNSKRSYGSFDNDD